MKTIVVTGGAGFIGSCLVRRLLADPQVRVVNYDKLTYAGNLDSLQSVSQEPRHVFVQGDICDRAQLQQVLEQFEPCGVLHLAAESHVDRSIDGPAEFIRTNIQGTFELLEAARRYWSDLGSDERDRWRLVNVSTDEVFGSLGASGCFTEESPYQPNSPYSASKGAADHLVRAYFKTYGLPTITTHCSNNYGPFQFPEKLIPLMILNAVEGRELPVYGDGQNVRDWLFVDDHVSALLRVFADGVPGETYNIGGHSELPNLAVARQVCALVDRLCPNASHRPTERLIQFVPDRPGHDRRYAMDTAKIEQQLGWRPQQTFPSGLELTVRWYLENPTWVQRVASGQYRRERLGLAQNRTSL